LLMLLIHRMTGLRWSGDWRSRSARLLRISLSRLLLLEQSVLSCRLLLLDMLLLLHLLLHELCLGLSEPIDLSLGLGLLQLSEVQHLLRRDRLRLSAWILPALWLHDVGRNSELLLSDRFQAVHCLNKDQPGLVPQQSVLTSVYTAALVGP